MFKDKCFIIRDKVAQEFINADSAHDLSHLDRVAGLCRKLATTEGGNVEVMVAAVYLHDFHRILEKQTNREHVTHDQAWELAEIIAREAGIDENLWQHIRSIIEHTSSYSFGSGLPQTWSIETAIVHDADNLDAIGAIGIARAFSFGGMLHEKIWKQHPLPSSTYRSGKTDSVIAHFYEKLLRLTGDMLTETGKKIAEERTIILYQFLKNFFAEWAFAIETDQYNIDIWEKLLSSFNFHS